MNSVDFKLVISFQNKQEKWNIKIKLNPKMILNITSNICFYKQIKGFQLFDENFLPVGFNIRLIWLLGRLYQKGTIILCHK